MGLSRSWQRRICSAVFLVALAVLILFGLPYLAPDFQNSLFSVSFIAAGGAGLTLIAAVLGFFLPLKSESSLPTTIAYVLLSITLGVLVFQTGLTGSPFLVLWSIIVFFGGAFGLLASLPLIGAIGLFIAADYLDQGLSIESIAVVSLSSVLPLVAGFIVWRSHLTAQPTKTDGTMKNLVSQLSEVATKSEVVINAIGDGVVAIDSQGIIQLINPAAQELLGWGKQDAMMLNYKSVLQLADLNNHPLDQAHDPVQQVLNTNQQIRSNDLTMVTKSSKKLFVSLVISPIGDAGSGVIAVFRDITKEKAEEREQAEFISTASHEMRTPVASIEGYLGLALNPQTSQIDAKAREFILKAHESAQHLGRLFQDLLDVSKAEDGRLSNAPKVVDLTAFVHDIVQGLAPKAQEKNLHLVYTPMPDNGQKQVAPVYYVNLDNDHIREVVSNLVENAIKYTPQGEVTVDLTGTEDRVVVSIKDTGIGIPAEDIPHLFQKFYRVDNADTQQIGGTGLGLYLSRRLAEALGGRIWVESIYKKGSTFYLELPRIDTAHAELLKEQQQQPIITPTAAAAVFTSDGSSATAPVATPVAASTPVPVPTPTPPAAARPAATLTMQDVRPATTVPRGESLSREQIAAHVARLQAMAKEQPAAPTAPGQQ